MQKTIRMGGALLAAVVAAAGAAQASDDCRSGSFAGYYGTLCLFDEHAYQSSYCGEGYCYASDYAYNTPAYHNLNTPAGHANVAVTQYDNVYRYCDAYGCFASDGTGTTAWASAGAPGAASLDANGGQWANGNDAPWGTYYNDATNAYARAAALDQYASLNAQQYSYQDAGAGYSYCNNNVYLDSSVYTLSAYGPCQANTPAGPVSLRVPMLHATCVPAPVPEATLCGRFPDWPDDTGLPFL